MTPLAGPPDSEGPVPFTGDVRRPEVNGCSQFQPVVVAGRIHGLGHIADSQKAPSARWRSQARLSLNLALPTVHFLSQALAVLEAH